MAAEDLHLALGGVRVDRVAGGIYVGGARRLDEPETLLGLEDRRGELVGRQVVLRQLGDNEVLPLW